MKFYKISILLFLLFTFDGLYAQNSSEFMKRFFNDHKVVKKDSLHYKMLLKDISKNYESAFEEITDSFISEKSSKFNLELFSGIYYKPCIRVLLDSGIYLYVTARLTSYYDKPKYQDTTFIAKIYDNNTNTTIHNFDIIKLNKYKVFTSIIFESDTIKYYVNASLKGKALEEKGDCPPPYECIESCCYNFILKGKILKYVGLVLRIGYGRINKNEFYFKHIRYIGKDEY